MALINVPPGQDIREELVIIALFAVAVVALILDPGSQVAAGAAGALGGYLKGRKNSLLPAVSPPPRLEQE